MPMVTAFVNSKPDVVLLEPLVCGRLGTTLIVARLAVLGATLGRFADHSVFWVV